MEANKKIISPTQVPFGRIIVTDFTGFIFSLSEFKSFISQFGVKLPIQSGSDLLI
jgi:hypothetical protein